MFPPEEREYELVYHGKEREEDIIANTLAVPLQKSFNVFFQKLREGELATFRFQDESNPRSPVSITEAPSPLPLQQAFHYLKLGEIMLN